MATERALLVAGEWPYEPTMTITESEVAIGAWVWHESRPEMSSSLSGNSVCLVADSLQQCNHAVQLTDAKRHGSFSGGTERV